MSNLLKPLIKEIKESIYFKLQEKLFRIKKYFIEPPPPKPKIVRSAFSKRYCGPSGIDTKVYFTEEGGEKKALGYVQGVSFRELPGGLGGVGSMVVLIFDNKDCKALLGKKGRLELISSEEEREPIILFDSLVRFKDFSFGIAVDDIVAEGSYTFDILVEKADE
jgi:hypothetical protein